MEGETKTARIDQKSTSLLLLCFFSKHSGYKEIQKNNF